MSWMDGINKWSPDHYTKAGPCHMTTSDTGEHQATFSDIRFGAIGTTLPGQPPAPTPTPAPTPASAGGCNDGTVIGEDACGYNCDDNCNCGRCNTKPGCASEDQCLSNCNVGGNAKWCPKVAPTPAPTPVPTPAPAPVPSPSSGCCSWDGKYCGDTTDYCKASADQCADCDGKWCADCLPPYTTTAIPAPSPTPTPAPSDCPGGSLNACIDLCPADVFAACVESCQKRCASDVAV